VRLRFASESTNQPADDIQSNGGDNLGVREQGAESIKASKNSNMLRQVCMLAVWPRLLCQDVPGTSIFIA